MGKLIPVFEDTGRGKLFEGLFRDEESGKVGHLEVAMIADSGTFEGQSRANVDFVTETKE